MKRITRRICMALSLIVLCLQCGVASADSEKVKACYEQKDKACLKALYEGIAGDNTPEKQEAVYYLGMLYMAEEDYESAKSEFEISTMFTNGDPRSTEKLIELVKSGNVKVEVSDCRAVQTEECFLNVAKSDPEKAAVAYYSLARFLSKTNPERAAEYTVKAAEMGHGTSECLLAFGYAHEKVDGPSVLAGFTPELPLNFEKSRTWFKQCVGGPFYGYRDKHFKKYQAANSHKAYAKMGSRYKMFSSGAATPELAGYVAANLCDTYAKNNPPKNKNKKPTNEKCKVVNIDGQWVDYYVPGPLPSRTGSMDDIIRASARAEFPKYTAAPAPKVFVQGPLGNWTSRSMGTDVSIEEVTRQAIESCQDNGWYTKYGSACEVINVNDQWVK